MYEDFEVILNVRFSVEDWAKLKRMAAINTRSFNSEVLVAVDKYIKQERSRLSKDEEHEFYEWTRDAESHAGDGITGPIRPVRWKKGRGPNARRDKSKERAG